MADKKRRGIELKIIGAKQPRAAKDLARLGVDSQASGDRTARHATPRPPAADESTLSLRTFSQTGPVRGPREEQAGDSRETAHTRESPAATTLAPSNAPLPVRFFTQSGPVRSTPAVPLSKSAATKPAETMQPTGPLNRTKVSIQLDCVASGLINGAEEV